MATATHNRLLIIEEQFLTGVARRFGLTDTEFAYVKARHVIGAKAMPVLSSMS